MNLVPINKNNKLARMRRYIDPAIVSGTYLLALLYIGSCHKIPSMYNHMTGTGGIVATGGTTGAGGVAGTTGTGGTGTGGVAGTTGTGGTGTGGVAGTTGTGGTGTGGVAGTTGTGGVAGTTGTGGVAGTTGTGGTGTGGTGGGSGNCGNGVVNPGEYCDGSDLQGATCASLGFTGGSLSCSSSCQFNASACTGAGLTLNVTASRTSCVAPCGVAFDTISTTGLSAGDYVAANWDWDFNDPTSSHPLEIGFVAKHIFDNPGSYVVTTRGRDLAGATGWATKTITVSVSAYTIYYISNSGSDSNPGTTTTTAFATLAKGFTVIGSNVALKFRRGDTFIAGPTARTVPNGSMLTAYTDPAHISTAAPIITSAQSGGFDAIFAINGTDPKITDIHLTSTGGFTAITLNTTSHALFERIEINGLGYFDGSNYAGQNFYVDTNSNATFVFDNYLHDFIGYGLYGDAVKRLGFTGNILLRYNGGDHGIRTAGGDRSSVTYNNITGGTTPTPQSAITIRGDDTNMVVAHNTTNRLIEFTPQNTDSVEHVQDGLCEGNLVADDRPVDYYPTGIGITAKHIIVRNNMVSGTPTAVSVSGQPQMPPNWTDKIVVYNNTHYFNPASYNPDFGAAMTEWFTSTGSMHVFDNIFYITIPATGADVKYLGADGTGTTSEDHNLGYDPNWLSGWNPGTGTGDTIGNPHFVSTSGVFPFQIQSTSAARNIGTASPAYEDSVAVTRPKESIWDIGACEYKP